MTTTVDVGDDVVLTNAARAARAGGGDGDLRALVLSRRGVAVFLESGSEGRPPQLRRLDLRGSSAIDTGAIDPASLAISRDGRRVYWLREGVPQSASL